jgi:hypothetical protein
VTRPAGGPPEDSAWPDDLDAAILTGLRDLHEQLDPPPPDLTERVLFALASRDLDGELARLQADQLVGSGARSGERTRTISFDAPSLAIMVTVVDLPDGRLRLDGWLAPAAALRVELRLGDGTRRTTLSSMADAAGRFVFATVPHGLVQLVVSGPGAATVLTPAVVL